jgi:hypothetical protein
VYGRQEEEEEEEEEEDSPPGSSQQPTQATASRQRPKNPDTRRRRVDVSISKMKSGKRRPCCFNLSACTDPDLSKNGRLLEPGGDRP